MKNNIASSAEESINHAINFEISEKIPNAKSSDVNEVLLPFPEDDVELEISYQIKHKKIDKEVDSQVDFKNNKSTVKKTNAKYRRQFC